MPHYGEHLEIQIVAKALACEMIMLALSDLENFGVHRMRFWESTEHTEFAKDALCWFKQRLTTPFGYGWCLAQSEMNPNLIRRVINKLLARKGNLCLA